MNNGQKVGGTLKNWKLNDDGMGGEYLTGNIYGDDRFEDGALILSSTVQDIDGDQATTANTIYILEAQENETVSEEPSDEAPVQDESVQGQDEVQPQED